MKQIKKTLYLDFDGTIVNSIKAIVDMYNEDFCYYKKFTNINWYDVETWGFEELALADNKYVNAYFNQPRFFRTIEFMDNAESIIPQLTELFETKIVSHGYSPNLKGKADWIKLHMPYVSEFIGVNLKENSDKSCVDMSEGIFIDDSANNLSTSNAKIKICFGDEYLWNKKWDGVRCYNWNDIKRYLQVIEKRSRVC